MADENLALDMVKAGQEVMQKSIQNAAQKHVKSNSMAKSIKCSKPTINRSGDAVGRVKFYGSDGVSRGKNGQRFDRRNWVKAFRVEYGRKNQPAQPFVRPAIKSCESSVRAAMQKIFDKKVRA